MTPIRRWAAGRPGPSGLLDRLNGNSGALQSAPDGLATDRRGLARNSQAATVGVGELLSARRARPGAPRHRCPG